MFDSINKKNGPKIIACCGSGGVGKTTISATLGLHAALAGKKTIVLTIDPARRLADSLGLLSMEYEKQRISSKKFIDLGLNPDAQLDAMMLDTKRTFDRLIGKYASSVKLKNIVNNRYYKHISSCLAGSLEYMAMERLYEIYNENKYDLIILDTPPTRRALDFLEAPQRVSDLLGHNFFWKIFKPSLKAGKLGIQIFNVIASPFIRAASKVMGRQVFDEIGDFFRLWDDVFFEGFRQRALEVQKLLSSSETLFYAISSPMRVPLNEALFLYEKLKEHNIPFGGFIINRVHRVYNQNYNHDYKQYVINNENIKNLDIDSVLLKKLMDNFNSHQELGKSNLKAIKHLTKQVEPTTEIKKIYCLDQDVYDFKGLLNIRKQLFP